MPKMKNENIYCTDYDLILATVQPRPAPSSLALVSSFPRQSASIVPQNVKSKRWLGCLLICMPWEPTKLHKEHANSYGCFRHVSFII